MYLQTNGKLRDSSVYTYAFNLPAVSTCPGAGICREYCFAKSEQQRYPSANAYRERSLALSKSAEFRDTIHAEIARLRKLHSKAGTQFAVRIHASGDFYSVPYMRAWETIIRHNADVQFYAYTKSIALWKRYLNGRTLPSNFVLIYSMGSNHDSAINTETDRHARIFQTAEQALAAGYTLASEDDTVAWQAGTNKIGLVVFGATAKFATLQRGA